MAEQGAAPDNGVAVERREAQRPTSLGARASKRSPWVTRNGRRRAVGPIARARQRGPRKPPGASRRSIPSLEGRKKGNGVPGAAMNTVDDARLFYAVIPGRVPTGPAKGRPDDKLRTRTRNPETRSVFCIWIPDNRVARGFRNDEENGCGCRMVWRIAVIASRHAYFAHDLFPKTGAHFSGSCA